MVSHLDDAVCLVGLLMLGTGVTLILGIGYGLAVVGAALMALALWRL